MTDEELIARLRKYGDDLLSITADRIEQLAVTNEALTEQLTAARDDAKEAEAYAEELEADRKKTYEALLKVSRIHGEVEAKLAKAVEALDEAVYLLDPDEKDMMRQAGVYRIVTTLAEIKGGNDAKSDL